MRLYAKWVIKFYIGFLEFSCTFFDFFQINNVQLDVPKAQFFKWSPNGDQIVTFHMYYETKDNPNPGIYNNTGLSISFMYNL